MHVRAQSILQDAVPLIPHQLRPDAEPDCRFQTAAGFDHINDVSPAVKHIYSDTNCY